MKTVYEILRIKQVIKEVDGGEKFIVRSPEDAAKIAAEFIGDENREVFFVMCLNTKNRVVAVHRCHVGGLNVSLVIPREVFKSAILNNSASIIVSHQHPSQDISPSREDLEVTKRLAECGKILGIEVLDHVIVNAEAEYYSMKEKGINLEFIKEPMINTNSKTDDVILKAIQQAVLVILTAFAEKERSDIRVRQAEGIEAAKRKGTKFGRPLKMLPEEWDELYLQWKNGQIMAVEFMDCIGTKKSTFYKKVNKYEQFNKKI